VYEYHIQGPSGLDINYKNLFVQSTTVAEGYYQGIQKWMRYPMIVAYLDLITDGSHSGRYPPTVLASARQAVSIERTMRFSLKMPEEAGAVIGVNTGVNPASGQIQLGSRRDCYFHKVYTMNGPTQQLERVDVENPTMVIDNS
jgi:hypothetical protein